jgi:CHAD domain-containing protein
LPHRPAGEGARLVALAFFDAAAAALARLDDPEDQEALHDFRVALRRTRSTLRAYRPLLGQGAAKRLRRGLRALGRATNEGRDAEVQLAWLRGQEGKLAPREQPGLRWLEARFDDRRRSLSDGNGRILPRAFAKLAPRLRKRLAVYRVKVHIGETAAGTSFGAAAAQVLRRHGAELVQRLEAIDGAEDAAGAHATRIAVKRTRYVLEPLAARTQGGRALVRELQQIQDTLGELNDAHVLAQEIMAAVAETAAERARYQHQVALDGKPGSRPTLPAHLRRSPRAGLLALARLLQEDRDQLFERLVSEWQPRAAELAEQVEHTAASLERAAVRVAPPRRAPATRRRRAAARRPSPAEPAESAEPAPQG